tara:strand:- start:1457 stop:1720 length:264 start_codon:yes stop_codon:yes gene_type:complete
MVTVGRKAATSKGPKKYSMARYVGVADVGLGNTGGLFTLTIKRSTHSIQAPVVTAMALIVAPVVPEPNNCGIVQVIDATVASPAKVM